MKPLFLAVFLFVFSMAASAVSLDEITSFGVYVEGKDGYVKLRPYEHNYFELKRLKSIPYVERDSQLVNLVIYQQEFNADLMAIKAQYIALAGGSDTLQVDVSPTDREDMYKLAVVGDVPDNRVLFFSSGWFGYHDLAVSLAEPEGQLETLLSDMEQPAHAALPTVEEMIEAYPDNAVFKALLPKWQAASRKAEDDRDYGYVVEIWQQYQNSERLPLKAQYLQRLRGELNRYLQKHPEGEKTDEAKQRLEYANTRITELEKLL